ncbi:hypothetical protein D3C80_1157290 [compost metagenome]
MQRAVAFRLALRFKHFIGDFRLRLPVPFLRPDAAQDEMFLQSQNRITQRPGIGFRLGAIGTRIVRGGMGADAIGHIFDQRRAEIAACPFHRPARHGINGEIIIAVDPECGNAEAQPACRKGAGTTARNALKGGNGPLIVDDIENDRGLVGGGEDQRGVEIRLRRRTVANPRSRDFRIAFDGRGHRPANRLHILRGEVA